jgi:hypothetical protein
MLIEKEKPVPLAELLQSDRRAFLPNGIDPVEDGEFEEQAVLRWSESWLSRSSDSGEVRVIASASRVGSRHHRYWRAVGW